MKISCRHFKGHKPCTYHLHEEVECNDDCSYHRPIDKKILIIKLDSLGDVLRTTSILHGLKEKYFDAHITWITKSNAIDLLKNNPLIDRVLPYSYETVLMLQQESFSLILNPSNDRESAVLASMFYSDEKLGYGYDSIGNIYPYNPEAVYWLQLAISNRLKKENMHTYQEIMLNMFRLKTSKKDTMLYLTDDEITQARDFFYRNNINQDDFVVGVNTGAGEKWPLKMLSVDKTAKLINRLSKELNARVVLFGGKRESERNRQIISLSDVKVIDAGTDNTLLGFAAKMYACDLLVTSDSLALHVAAALKKKIVAFFGPTSHSEIELYGRGIKVVPKEGCVCCYSREHKKDNSCIDYVSVDEIINSVKKLR